MTRPLSEADAVAWLLAHGAKLLEANGARLLVLPVAAVELAGADDEAIAERVRQLEAQRAAGGGR